ncbi:MAG: hypothetical protein FWF33_02250 [Clostridiales bacterium]|nr:hypothetical protein [Clostridiales bacterium]
MLKKIVKKILRNPYHAGQNRLNEILQNNNKEFFEQYKKYQQESMADLLCQVNEKFRLADEKIDQVIEPLNAKTDRLNEQLNAKTDRLTEQIKLQQAIVAVNTAAFEEYKNKHNGQAVVIVGAGPSLNYYKPLDKAIHIGVNRVCKSDSINLDYYFTQDFRNPNHPFMDDILKIKCKVFLGICAGVPPLSMDASESLSAHLGATRYYFDKSPSEYICPDIRFYPLMDFYTVVFPAIHFALYTNPKSLYLVGCDTSYFGYFSTGRHSETIPEMRYHLFHRMIGYKKLKEFAQHYYPDTEIFSINPVNLRGLFKDIYTDDYIKTLDTENIRKPLFENQNITEETIRLFVDEHVAEVQALRESSATSVFLSN